MKSWWKGSFGFNLSWIRALISPYSNSGLIICSVFGGWPRCDVTTEVWSKGSREIKGKKSHRECNVKYNQLITFIKGREEGKESQLVCIFGRHTVLLPSTCGREDCKNILLKILCHCALSACMLRVAILQLLLLSPRESTGTFWQCSATTMFWLLQYSGIENLSMSRLQKCTCTWPASSYWGVTKTVCGKKVLNSETAPFSKPPAPNNKKVFSQLVTMNLL